MKHLKNPIGYIIILMLSAFVIEGCSKDDEPVDPSNPSTKEYDREPLLTNLANNYIIPAYDEYQTQTTNLKTTVTNFNTTPSITTLQALQTQWENTLLVWQDIAFLEFGPAANISLRSQTNVYPVDTALINANISSGSYDLQLPSNFDAKGFQALDYLINGKAGSDQGIVDFFNGSANAQTYLQNVVDEIASNASTVKDDWVNNFTTSFIANSASNAVGSSISNIINTFVEHYEAFIRKGKVGLPAGVFNTFSQAPLPSHVEALYYEQSLPFVLRSVSAIQKFVRGESYANNTNGEGLDDFMSFVNAQTGGQALEMVINNQLETIKTELNTLNDPFSNEVTNNNAAVRDAYEEMQKLVAYLKVDMTNALDVLITYQDNDGD